MKILATYEPEEIFALSHSRAKAVLEGFSVRVRNQRIVLFRDKGTVCVSCATVGTFFQLEQVKEETPHLNLYGVNARGKTVLFTKDHIHPRSKGGANAHFNYQTMCAPCNGKKGNKLPTEES